MVHTIVELTVMRIVKSSFVVMTVPLSTNCSFQAAWGTGVVGWSSSSLFQLNLFEILCWPLLRMLVGDHETHSKWSMEPQGQWEPLRIKDCNLFHMVSSKCCIKMYWVWQSHDRQSELLSCPICDLGATYGQYSLTDLPTKVRISLVLRWDEISWEMPCPGDI